MFYYFNQNNSGGGFVTDKEAGLACNVIIEADNYDAAIKKSEEIGIYFDGVDAGMDCECCGDRWYLPDETESPVIYGKDVFSAPPPFLEWEEKGFNVCIHYKDGRKVWL